MLNRLLGKPHQRFYPLHGFPGGISDILAGIGGSENSALQGLETVGVANAQVSASNVTHSFLVPVGWSHSILGATQNPECGLRFNFPYAHRNVGRGSIFR